MHEEYFCNPLCLRGSISIEMCFPDQSQSKYSLLSWVNIPRRGKIMQFYFLSGKDSMVVLIWKLYDDFFPAMHGQIHVDKAIQMILSIPVRLFVISLKTLTFICSREHCSVFWFSICKLLYLNAISVFVTHSPAPVSVFLGLNNFHRSSLGMLFFLTPQQITFNVESTLEETF